DHRTVLDNESQQVRHATSGSVGDVGATLCSTLCNDRIDVRSSGTSACNASIAARLGAVQLVRSGHSCGASAASSCCQVDGKGASSPRLSSVSAMSNGSPMLSNAGSNFASRA